MPKLSIPAKMLPAMTKHKRFKLLVGGRGSGKSQGVGGLGLMKAQTERAKTLCLRELQNSIEDSVLSLLTAQIKAYDLHGFTDTKTSIQYLGEDVFKFKGLSRNPDAVKSMHGFKYAWVEEAQAISEDSLQLLTPTLREAGSEIIFTLNPGSSADPMSERFINPFLDQLLTNGYYEDDLHLIIWMNYMDNPWFPDELEAERQWDYQHLPRALYDHIWLGKFNDSIENSLIHAEWFDACIDAHERLGWKAEGVIQASHDPSDLGPDAKGYALRHGSVLLDCKKNDKGDIAEGGDWATGLAIQAGVNAFTWDADGMGVGLNRSISKAFDGKQTILTAFKGSESPDYPDATYQPADGAPIRQQKKNKDVFRNKRAQYYFGLRDRVYTTFRAVEHGEYADPEKMISFSSDISDLNTLRSELCRIPIKPSANGYFELYTKADQMRKFSLPSPNMADSVMMAYRFIQPTVVANTRRPQAIKQMGASRRQR